MTPKLSTTGGTSDARFIKDMCPVTEFGLVGQTMHAVDEKVDYNPIEKYIKANDLYNRYKLNGVSEDKILTDLSKPCLDFVLLF